MQILIYDAQWKKEKKKQPIFSFLELIRYLLGMQ